MLCTALNACHAIYRNIGYLSRQCSMVWYGMVWYGMVWYVWSLGENMWAPWKHMRTWTSMNIPKSKQAASTFWTLSSIFALTLSLSRFGWLNRAFRPLNSLFDVCFIAMARLWSCNHCCQSSASKLLAKASNPCNRLLSTSDLLDVAFLTPHGAPDWPVCRFWCASLGPAPAILYQNSPFKALVTCY